MAERAPNSPSVTFLEELSPGSQVVGLAGQAFDEEAGRYRGIVAGAHADVLVKPEATAPQLEAELPEAAATEAGATGDGAGGGDGRP